MKYIYISLNGASDFEKIRRKITLQLLYHRKDSNKIDFDLVDDIFEIGGNIPNWGGFVDIFSAIREKIEIKRTDKINFDNVFIILDDLERVSKELNTSDVLGLIFENYVKKGVKTLFISDESNIQDKAYLVIKEKIIRRTISYEPSFDKQIMSLINNKYNEYSRKNILIENIEIYLNLFNKLQVRNLRTICFIFDNFLTVINSIDDKYIEKQKNFLFTNIMVLTIEFKKGNISISNQHDKKGLDSITQYPFFFGFDKKEEEKTYADSFYEEYVKQLGLNFIFVNTLFDFVLCGYCDIPGLENELDILFYNTKSKEEQVIINIGSYREMEEEELKSTLDELVIYAKNGLYHLYKLPYIYSLLMYHESRKYISDWPYDVENILDEAFNKSIQNLDNVPKIFDLDINLYDDQQRQTTYYNKLISLIKMECDKRQFDDKNIVIKEIFELAISNDDSVYNKLNEYSHSELFKDIVTTGSENYFLRLNNAGIRYFEYYINEDILRITNAGEYGYSQKEPLEKIVQFVSKNIETLDVNNMRKKRLYELINQMEAAIAHLENTRRK